MESIALAVLILLGVMSGAIVAYYFARRTGSKNAATTPDSTLLQNQIQQLQQQISTQMNQVMGMVNERLKEGAQSAQQSTQVIGERIDNAAKAYTELQKEIGHMKEASEQIFDIGKNISSFQEMLRAPKFRGSIGEFLLSELLFQILPPKFIELQYRFKSGEAVDAVIKLKDGLIPIDSKFPLENFKRMVETADDNARKVAERTFVQDVKKHIDVISRKYILPDEGTFSFALMYIPAENVFYETIIKDNRFGEDRSILQYAMERKVHPVSPNSFYAYMQTILYGLRGMQIEERAKELWSHIAGLRGDYDRIIDTFSVLGGHLTNAASKYNEVEKRLDKFGGKLEVTQTGELSTQERAAIPSSHV